MKFSIIGYISLLFIKFTFMPSIKILGWVFFAVLIDFITGVLKAKLAKQQLTSGGFRQTAVKCLQYFGLIIGGVIMGNSFEQDSQVVHWVNDGMLLFILYVEVYSIFENLYAMNPNSKVASMIFKPMMTILTIGLERNSLKSPEEPANATPEVKGQSGSTTTTIVVSLCLSTLFSCKVIKPGLNIVKEKTDTTFTTYKQVDFDIKGATVANTINMDSLFSVLQASLKSTNPNTNLDSLFKAFKNTLKPIHDTTAVTDPNTKVQLKYWYDAYGKLQMTCTSKDETVQLLVAEVTKLHKEVENSKEIEVVYKMPRWGWIVIGGCGVLSFLALSIIVFAFIRSRV